MNLITKLFLAFTGSAAISIMISIIFLLIMKSIVYIFELNYGRDVYWVLTATNCVFGISWLVLFGYFMTILS